MTLYRVVSKAENSDFILNNKRFRTSANSLEGKQFFKSEDSVKEFADIATKRKYRPPYIFMITVDVNDECLAQIPAHYLVLDGFEAVSIPEDCLEDFNNCLNFTTNCNINYTL